MDNQNVPWIPVGPAPIQHSLDATGGVSGRVWCIAASPNYDGANHPAMYIGTQGGGVWRSADFAAASPTWTPLTDRWPTVSPQHRQNLLDVGALAVDPWNPGTLYAGTGDPPNALGLYAWGFMLKSTNGGDTWGLLDFAPHEEPGPGIQQIFVDPTEPTGNTVYASGGLDTTTKTQFVIRKSIDGGKSWTISQNGLPADIIITGFDSSVRNGRLVLYTGVCDNSGTNPQASTVWKSDDKGASWTPMTFAPLIDRLGRRRSQSEIGWVVPVTNAPQNPIFGGGRPAFAAVGWFNPTHNPPVWDILNIFELVGDTWQPAARGLPDTPNSMIQVTSGFAMAMSSGNDLYMGAVTSHSLGLWQRLFATGTWVSIDHGMDNSQPHTDHHAWCFVDGDVYNGNDGGINRFKPRPDGTPGPGVWQNLNTPGLQTILVNGVGMHPTYPNVLAEGSQDNGVAVRERGSWTHVVQGDNGRIRFDPYDGRFVYLTGVSDKRFFSRSDDGGHTWVDKSVPNPQNVPWYASFDFHTFEAGRICVGLDRVHETVTRGDQWTPISPPLGNPGDVISAVAYGRAGSGSSSKTIFAAYESGRLFRTTNGGGPASNWPEVNPGTDWHGKIVSIVTDPHSKTRVYAATDQGSIWRSGDGGATWSEIEGDRPGDGSQLRVYALELRSDTGDREPTLFAATSVGVWTSTEQNGKLHWQQMDGGLPDTDVKGLQFHQTNKNIVAGLYGRGVFGAYLHLKTGLGPGSVAVRDRIFTFAVDLDERVLVNQAKLDDAFSGWFEVQGNKLRAVGAFPSQKTNAAPAAVAAGDRLFVFIKDATSGLVLVNMAVLGGLFDDYWHEVQSSVHTDAAPSALAIGNRLFVFIREAGTGRILLNQATLAGPSFPRWLDHWPEVQGNERTDAAPSALSIGNRLFVFIKEAESGRILLNQAVLDSAFQPDWAEVGGNNGHTDAAPSAMAIGNRLFVFIKEAGTGRILLNQATLAGPSLPRWLDHWVEVQGGGRTDAAPSAMAIGTRLFLFIKDADTGHVLLNQAVLDSAFLPQWFEVGGGLG
ncbi:hypothetical protein ACFY0A_46020 [Streptomyces sp. NPDC001698]|uniref:hypothetical protein n=1 Tax=Streptomyces sp. NPDC001698 TaxID=3364601 RepID=UPI00367D0680